MVEICSENSNQVESMSSGDSKSNGLQTEDRKGRD